MNLQLSYDKYQQDGVAVTEFKANNFLLSKEILNYRSQNIMESSTSSSLFQQHIHNGGSAGAATAKSENECIDFELEETPKTPDSFLTQLYMNGQQQQELSLQGQSNSSSSDEKELNPILTRRSSSCMATHGSLSSNDGSLISLFTEDADDDTIMSSSEKPACSSSFKRKKSTQEKEAAASFLEMRHKSSIILENHLKNIMNSNKWKKKPRLSSR